MGLHSIWFSSSWRRTVIIRIICQHTPLVSDTVGHPGAMQGERETLGVPQGGLGIESKGSMPHSRAPSPPHTPPSMNESGWLGCEVGGFLLLSEVRASMSPESKMIDAA